MSWHVGLRILAWDLEAVRVKDKAFARSTSKPAFCNLQPYIRNLKPYMSKLSPTP